ICVEEDPAAVHAAAREQLGRYFSVPSYARMSAAAGYPAAADGEFSDAHIDALVLHGDEVTVARRLREWLAIGADEVIAAPLGAGADRAESVRRAITLVAAMAR
ncbi:MAG: hypothetical protein K6T92_08720, partial [Candidatus Rokubacteria bacterium]|nr:hypothetical protein [Candidatus Rokubacteria bacterium]